MAKCARCNTGPQGIEGHEDLSSSSMGAGVMQFRCRNCETVWSRHYGGGGGFVWSETHKGDYGGLDLPGARPRN